jgi:hypothetical protein
MVVEAALSAEPCSSIVVFCWTAVCFWIGMEYCWLDICVKSYTWVPFC